MKSSLIVFTYFGCTVVESYNDEFSFNMYNDSAVNSTPRVHSTAWPYPCIVDCINTQETRVIHLSFPAGFTTEQHQWNYK